MRKIIIALSLVLSLALPAFAFQATVTAVHDGDTLTLDTGQRVRLWGVDAPETKSRRWAAQPGADGARDALAAMTMMQIVEVEQKGRSYDRIVAVVTLADGRNVSGELVAAGWAWVEPRYCKVKRICGPWREAEDRAKAAGKGIWGPGNPVPPWEWRKADFTKAQP